MAGFMDKTETQQKRKNEIKTLAQSEETRQMIAPIGVQQSVFIDEAQMQEDKVKIGEKKTWKPDAVQADRNAKIDAAKKITPDATADTLMISQTLNAASKWQLDEDHAFRLLSMTRLDSKMLISANIRAHYGEYMQIVRCYELIKKRMIQKDNEYEKHLGERMKDFEIFYERMKAFTEQNRMHLDGKALGKKEVPAEFKKDRARIMKGEIFTHQRREDYSFSELKDLDKDSLKELLAREDETEKYNATEAIYEVMHANRHLGYKMYRYGVDAGKLKEYDTPEGRIKDIKDMREQIRFLDNTLDENGEIQRRVDYRIYRGKESIKRERLELMARLNLAEAEARLALVMGEADAATIKAAKAEVLDAWDDYTRVQKRLAIEEMPLVANDTPQSTMTRSEAITSKSDQMNFAYKKTMLQAAEELPEDIPELRKVKNLALAYAKETHYTIGCDEEAMLLGELYSAMKAAEKKGYAEQLTVLNNLKETLNGSTLPDFDDIPDNTNLKLFDDTVVHEGMKLDFSKTRLKENGSRSDSGYYRNGFMNNDLMRKWVDVSDMPIFPHEPTVNDLRQGKVSNCYMLAATTGLIQQDPQAIKHIIKDNGDGTATVRLYRSPGEPVFIRVKKEVPRLRATDGAILTSGPLWMQLIEMAAAHVGMFKKDEKGKTKTGVGSLWYGTGAEWLQLLTGVPVLGRESLIATNDEGEAEFVGTGVHNADELYEKIRQVINDKCIVHMGTKSSVSNGMNSGHAYTVLGAREINGQKYITLRNPYANMSYQKSETGSETMSSSYFSSVADATCGQFDIPLEEFIRNAKDVNVTDLKKTSEGGKFYFADEDVTLKQIVDHGGTVPGLKLEMTEEQQQLTQSIDEGDQIFDEIESELRREKERERKETPEQQERRLREEVHVVPGYRAYKDDVSATVEIKAEKEDMHEFDHPVYEDTERILKSKQKSAEYGELMRSQKTFGDSKLMKAVKTDLAKVESLLDQPWTEEFKKENMDEVRRTYFAAIKSCDAYLAERDSTKKTGVQRRELVEKNKDRLIRELELMETGGELFINGRLLLEVPDSVLLGLKAEEHTPTLRSLIEKAKIYELANAPEFPVAAEKEKTSQTQNENLRKIISLFELDTERTFKKEEQRASYADSVGKLRAALRSFPKGKVAVSYAVLSGQQVMIQQDENGTVTISNGEASVVMKDNTADLIDMLDYKMIEEQGYLNSEDLKAVIGDQTVTMTMVQRGRRQILTKNAGDVQKAATRLARFLELKTGKPATYFSNFSTDILRSLAYGLASGANKEVVLGELERIEKKNETTGKMINTSETLELVRTSQKKKAEIAEKVTYKQIEKSEAQKREERLKELNGWDEQEFATKNLISDLVFSLDTWEADDSVTEPGERVRRMLLSHKDTLADIVADNYREDQTTPSLVDRILSKLPMALAGEDEGVFKRQVKDTVARITALIDKQLEQNIKAGIAAFGTDATPEEVKKQVDEKKRDKKLIRSAISLVLTSKDATVMEELAAMDQDIEDSVKESSERLQEEIANSVGELLNTNTEGGPVDRTEGLLDPKQKGIDPQEKDRRIKAGSEALGKIIEDSMKGESGQGKFVKTVFMNYFAGAELIDRRSMFAAALRNASPSRQLAALPEGATQEQIKAYEEELDKIREEEMGKYLGGMLKGAGPLFQKLMQGLPVSGLNESMREALEDVKSKLAPIPEEIVKAQLYGMVERSKGKITKIEISRALGAASVGQTFLCKIYGPDIPEEGKDVVVKLLKPDVRNRMMREKSIMLQCARLTDEGMVATYEGQLSRIEEELDLTIEARNVVKGEIYDKLLEGKEHDGVSSMKLVKTVDATTNSMMLEKAPGETVDRYLKETEDRIRTYREALTKRQGESNEDYAVRINMMRENIAHDMAQLSKRQQYMANLSQKWVTEGIFGKGFYHGDLHAGNIMINDEGLTVIDFGNATSLDKIQQDNVTRMVAAAAAGDAEGFMKGLYNLIKPEFQKVFDQKKNELKPMLKKYFSLGDKNASGQRIAVALLKTQELGIEVPSAIFNFSQCQLRLQAAVDDMMGRIESLQTVMRDIDKIPVSSSASKGDIYLSQLLKLNMTVPAGNEEEKPRDMLKKEVDQSMIEVHNLYDVASPEMYDEKLENGSFIEERIKDLYEYDEEYFSTRIDRFIAGIEDKIKMVKDNQKLPEKDRVVVKGGEIYTKDPELVDMFTNGMNNLGLSTDMFKLVDAVFIQYQSELSLKEKADPERLKELGGEGDATPQWVINLKDYLYEKAKLVTDMTSKAKEYERKKADSELGEEEKTTAKNEFMQAYCSFRTDQLTVNDNSETFGNLNIEELKDKMTRVVERTADLDEELGPQLLEEYAEYRTQYDKAYGPAQKRVNDKYDPMINALEPEAKAAKKEFDERVRKEREEYNKTHKDTPYITPQLPADHPDSRLKALKKQKSEELAREVAIAKNEIRRQGEKVVSLLVAITAKRYNAFYQNMEDAYVNEPKSFIDVMGDAITSNINKALSRLGWYTAYVYDKKIREG